MIYTELLVWAHEWHDATKTGFLVLLFFHLCFFCVQDKAEIAVLDGCCLQVSSTQAV